VRSAPVDHPDDLPAVAQFAVGGLARWLFDTGGLSLRQMDADRGLPLHEPLRSRFYEEGEFILVGNVKNP
jgi:hypothetical protein